jgi:transcriptional regulator with XRE-family HTH domain
MSVHNNHWTDDNVEDFAFRVAFDFVTQVKSKGENGGMKQAELAQRLRVSEGRVSQILNNPGNLTLKQIVKVARALGRKVSIVAYDDGDTTNQNGPINAEVFTGCWEMVGKPTDFYALKEAIDKIVPRNQTVNVSNTIHLKAVTAGPGVLALTFKGVNSVNSASEVDWPPNFGIGMSEMYAVAP